ncbi:C6 transcription factor [Histoplasma capsulatum]|uniref:C6 transcription factor n=1 Tax=Ajellomyces capsulatus TaxID=5037 RepID=A0A8A1MBE7_AJECA|nr:C6 transcription factor [Histoplasma capsulatum]
MAAKPREKPTFVSVYKDTRSDMDTDTDTDMGIPLTGVPAAPVVARHSPIPMVMITMTAPYGCCPLQLRRKIVLARRACSRNVRFAWRSMKSGTTWHVVSGSCHLLAPSFFLTFLLHAIVTAQSVGTMSLMSKRRTLAQFLAHRRRPR